MNSSRFGKSFGVTLAAAFFLAAGYSRVVAEETGQNSEEVKVVPLSERSITIGGKKLSLEEAVALVLQKNLTLQSSKYDVIMTDSEAKKFNKKYAPVFEVEGNYYNAKNPVASQNSLFGGNEVVQTDVVASLSKLFVTGTFVKVGVKETLSDTNDRGLNFGTIVSKADPPYHKPSVFIAIQQELLKNAFGYAQRKNEKILDNVGKMQRADIINKLSLLVVNALADYWQVTVNTRAVENAREELDSTVKVRNIIARNIGLGLSERFDLNQYNSLVAGAETRVKMTEQQRLESVRKLLRTVNMPPETAVEGLTDLVDTLPDLDKEESVKTAFAKRADYRNARLMVETAEMEISLHENNALPSLTIGGQVSSLTQNEAFGTAVGEIPQYNNPEYRASIKMSYPLWDEEIRTNVRNAHLKLRQTKIRLEDMKQEIRDEVLSRLERVQLQHSLLLNARTMKEESERHYSLLLARSRQGKFNAVAVKQSLDARSDARQRELEALVQYNVALLQLDLAKNEVFERYKVDVEKLLRESK